MKNLNFQSKKLVVHYLRFSIDGITNFDYVFPIANYLFNSFGFNSTYSKRIKSKKFYSLLSNPKNKYKVCFIKSEYNPELESYWDGIYLDFKGDNATHFYNLIQGPTFDWNIFELSSTTIGRFNYYYFRSIPMIN